MTMRRLFLIAAFAAAFATPVSAQSWQDMFKSAIQSLTGGTSSESAAATAAPEPLPEKELFGSWSYQAPAMEYTGDDMLASLAASTLKGQLPSYFQQAGLQPGKATVSFSRRGVFKAVLDTHKVEGVYRYDEDTGELTVECLFAGNPVSFTGREKHADGVLTLLFEANAALGSLRASSQQYAQNPKLQQIAAILERYPGVMLGAELKRRPPPPTPRVSCSGTLFVDQFEVVDPHHAVGTAGEVVAVARRRADDHQMRGYDVRGRVVEFDGEFAPLVDAGGEDHLAVGDDVLAFGVEEGLRVAGGAGFRPSGRRIRRPSSAPAPCR